jgi:cytosine/adenosine deaminase-related metal-dependent hydrolase
VAAERLRTPPAGPFIIHACEGTDEGARDEVQRLDEMGALDAATVMVHGVALDGPGIQLMQARRASLVWCPSSNVFTLGGTLSQEVLDSGIPIALGTDSALTAAGDLIDELRMASRYAPLDRLYRMITTDAAKILRVTRDPGDWIVIRDHGQSVAEALLDLPPELVFSGGQLKLASEAWAGRLPPQQLRGFQRIEVEGRGRFLIDCDVSALAAETRRILGDDFRLAGRRVEA